MRSLMLAAMIGLAMPAAAFAQGGADPKPGAKPRAAAAQPAASGTAVNADARRLEEARHKRWDERMRRATNSLCDRC